MKTLHQLDGTRFCLVTMTVIDEDTQKVKLVPIHGKAVVQNNQLAVVEPSGAQHMVPDSAQSSILPSDGTALLKDAQHYVIVKIATLSRK